jgi:hypothetical protein
MFIVLDVRVVLEKQVQCICSIYDMNDIQIGYAISLVTRENWASAGRLIKILEEAGQVC